MMDRPRILIVDDNPDDQAAMKRFLSGRFEVTTVFDGEECLSTVKDKSYDLLLLDYNMPKMDGLVTLTRLKEADFSTPIILLTGNGDEEIATSAMKLGASDYFAKEKAFSSSSSFISEIEKVVARYKERLFVTRMAEEFALAPTLTELSSLIVIKIKELFRIETCSLMLLDDTHNELYIASASGLPEHIMKETRIKIEERSVAGWVATKKEPLLVSDIKKDLPFACKKRERYKTDSFLSLPLLVGRKTIGLLNLTDKKDGEAFGKADLDRGISYITQTAMAMAIERTKLLEKKEEERRDKDILLRDINHLNDISFKLSLSLSIDETINSLNEGLFSLFELHISSILLITDTEKRLSISTSFPVTTISMREIKRYIKKKGSLLLPGLNIENLTLNLQERTGKKRRPYHIFACCLNMPLVNHEDIIGSIIIAREKDREFSRNDLTIFSTIVNHAASSLMNAVRFKDIKELADRDSLTNLLNHRSFYERLGHEVERAKRHQEDLSLLFLDIDDFKKINDRFGHIVGDEALLRLASIVKHACRQIDIPARYGGEEFCIILPETPNNDAKKIAERIRETVEREGFGYFRLTISCGVSSFPKECQDLKSLIKTTDERMYQAKQEGKNRVV